MSSGRKAVPLSYARAQVEEGFPIITAMILDIATGWRKLDNEDAVPPCKRWLSDFVKENKDAFHH